MENSFSKFDTTQQNSKNAALVARGNTIFRECVNTASHLNLPAILKNL